MGWWVYVIECESGVYYTGVTNDLEARFRKHAEGRGAKFFRLHKPLRIAATRACDSKSEALKLEAALKRLARRDQQLTPNAEKKLENLRAKLREAIDEGRLAECLVRTGLNRDTISDVANGRTNPRGKTAEKLDQYLRGLESRPD